MEMYECKDKHTMSILQLHDLSNIVVFTVLNSWTVLKVKGHQSRSDTFKVIKTSWTTFTMMAVAFRSSINPRLLEFYIAAFLSESSSIITV